MAMEFLSKTSWTFWNVFDKQNKYLVFNPTTAVSGMSFIVRKVIAFCSLPISCVIAELMFKL